MLYMVTTIDPDYVHLGFGFGVFNSYNLAVEAIQEYVANLEGYGNLENNGDGELYIVNNNTGACVSFYIEPCYVNIPLM